MGIIQNWKKAVNTRTNLDYLLSSISAEKSIRERLDWFQDLMHWISTPGQIKSSQLDFASGQGQLARVRYILQVLQRNEEWRRGVSRTLRSIIRDTEAVDLFSATGLPSNMGLAAEFTERLMNSWLPIPPREKDLGELITSWFPKPEYGAWVEKLDDDIFKQLLDLLYFDESEDEAGWNTLMRDIEDSLLLLAAQIRSQGLSAELRKRFSSHRLRDLPFYDLSRFTRAYIEAKNYASDEEADRQLENFRAALRNCSREISYAHDHLQEFGISIGVVYRLERMRDEIRRASTLSTLLKKDVPPRTIIKFLSYLVLKSAANRSLVALMRENFAILSKRIVERNAEVGSHYITRTSRDYWTMLKKAAGGGLITGPAVVAKIFAETAFQSLFLKGMLTSINYAGSFVVIQACNFTLATKQPAMTAPALARSIVKTEKENSLEPLLDEISHLTRSQAAAVLGNVVMVLPTVALLHYLAMMITGEPLISAQKSAAILQSHSILGATPFYAACTGVLLWLSSLIAGFVDNWSTYRQVPEAFSSNRVLNMTFGQAKVAKFSESLRKHLPALGGNISLGFLLGMTPQIVSFLGLTIDVRHVTLSTGMVGFALFSYGFEQVTHTELGLILLGLLIIGILNVFVSFSLALGVAIGSRRIPPEDRYQIYRALFLRFIRRPFNFVLPIGIRKVEEVPDEQHADSQAS
ncbi:MAG: hypothetical protein ACOH5I_09570 [Oligoflexus sp.]